jgi:UDP-N-acetylglucosamine pyrophosphorylase
VIQPNKEEKERFEKIGFQKIRENKIAAVLMAGGQGTRLNSQDPKGNPILFFRFESVN